MVAGLREKLVLLYFEKHPSTVVTCLDSSIRFASY